jgi:hypothetical protein
VLAGASPGRVFEVEGAEDTLEFEAVAEAEGIEGEEVEEKLLVVAVLLAEVLENPLQFLLDFEGELLQRAGAQILEFVLGLSSSGSTELELNSQLGMAQHSPCSWKINMMKF